MMSPLRLESRQDFRKTLSTRKLFRQLFRDYIHFFALENTFFSEKIREDRSFEAFIKSFRKIRF